MPGLGGTLDLIVIKSGTSRALAVLFDTEYLAARLGDGYSRPSLQRLKDLPNTPLRTADAVLLRSLKGIGAAHPNASSATTIQLPYLCSMLKEKNIQVRGAPVPLPGAAREEGLLARCLGYARRCDRLMAGLVDMERRHE